MNIGITSRKAIRSFEEVLFLTGNLSYPYIKKSVSDIRSAVARFDPDMIYSEFNLSAMIAARLENRRLFVTGSVPTQPEYASAPKRSSGLRRFLREHSLPGIDSCLELFSWADRMFVPSCRELEPFDKPVTYCGVFKTPALRSPVLSGGKNIVVYMGNGTVSPKKALRTISAAFAGRDCVLWFAGREYKERTFSKGRAVINTAPYFRFSELLPDSMLFINHGGQNSVADGLINGVPQLICPGRVFERIYNARSVVRPGAGAMLSPDEFVPPVIAEKADAIISDPACRINAASLGRELLSLGGARLIAEAALDAKKE